MMPSQCPHFALSFRFRLFFFGYQSGELLLLLWLKTGIPAEDSKQQGAEVQQQQGAEEPAAPLGRVALPERESGGEGHLSECFPCTHKKTRKLTESDRGDRGALRELLTTLNP